MRGVGVYGGNLAWLGSPPPPPVDCGRCFADHYSDEEADTCEICFAPINDEPRADGTNDYYGWPWASTASLANRQVQP
jgi:hypothetical protein